MDDIKTGFVYTKFDAIIREPTYETLLKLEQQVTQNAAATEV